MVMRNDMLQVLPWHVRGPIEYVRKEVREEVGYRDAPASKKYYTLKIASNGQHFYTANIIAQIQQPSRKRRICPNMVIGGLTKPNAVGSHTQERVCAQNAAKKAAPHSQGREPAKYA